MEILQKATTYFKAITVSSVIKNFCLTNFFQLVNILVPLLVTPHLVKTVGLSHFGEITYAFGIMSIFAVLTEYGFNLTATRQISIHRNDRKRLSAIFTNTLLARLVLFIFSVIIIFTGLYLINLFNEGQQINVHLYGLSTIYILGQALLPFWVFQGIETLFVASSINAFSKLAYVSAVLILVNEKQDYILVNFLLGLSILISATLLIIFLHKRHNIKFTKTTWGHVYCSLKEGWDIFIANISVNLYFGGINVLLVGLFADSTIVGYYGIVEKVIVICKQPIAVFTQVIYPKACALVNDGFEQIEIFVWKVAKPFIGINALLSLVVYSQAEKITNYFLKTDNTYVETLIKISAVLPFSVSFNLVPYICLLAYGYTRAVSKILVVVACVGVLLNCLLTYYLLAIGTVFSIIVTEALVATGLYFFAKQKHKISYDASAATM